MTVATPRELRLRKMLDLYEDQERNHREKGNDEAATRMRVAADRTKSEIAKVQKAKPGEVVGKPLPDYGSHMTMESFIEHCEQGLFIDWDGSGCAASETEMFDDMDVNPSDIVKRRGYLEQFTHMVWFNK